MAIKLTYGAYTNPANSTITEINFTEEMEQTSVSGVIMLWDNNNYATLKTLRDNLSDAIQKANQKLTIVIDDDGADVEIFEHDPATNTGFQIKGTLGFRTMTGRSMDILFSFAIQRPSFNATGDFPINTHISYDDAQRATVAFTGKYTGVGASSGKTNYESAVSGAVKKAETILAAYFGARTFQQTSESRNDKFSTDGVIEYTLQFIEKFVPEAFANWNIRNLNVTQLVGEPIGQPQTSGVAKKLGEKGHAAGKYAGSDLKPPVKYSVTFDAIFKGDTIKFDGFQAEYEANIKGFLWTHVLNNYMKVGHYNQTLHAFIESDNTNFGSQANTINVNWTVVGPDDSGVISYSDKITFNFTARKVREKYLDGEEDTYYSYSPGHKITMNYVATLVRVGNIPSQPAAPTVKPPSVYNYNPAGHWDIDEASDSGEILARPAISDDNVVMLYTKGFSSSYTWVVDKDLEGGGGGGAYTPGTNNF